jgi:type IV secretory pathway VirB2 component (pilin)
MQALHHPRRSPGLAVTLMIASLLLLLPELAAAAGFSLPFITGIGCDVVRWMKGELAIIVFLLVSVATFVVGLFARMDWTRILSIVVVYGILQGLASILLSTNTIQVPSCFS